MRDAILVVNAGSSSVKFSLYAAAASILRGQVEGIRAMPHLVVQRGAATVADEALAADCDHARATERVLDSVRRYGGDVVLAGVGHRVVHGGLRYAAPVLVTAAVLEDLESLVPLAPLHQPHSMAAIRTVAASMPGLPQVACFDTQFHRTQPEVAQAFALPPAITDQGVRRYGFHGLSYEYVAAALPDIDARAAQGRTVAAHLGAGASMCAMRGGRSIATTMGFTALDGLMMGTRAGSLDPGVVLHLMGAMGYGLPELTRLLYEQSGLLGVSGVSSDMRTLLASSEPRAEAAIELFCYRATRELGSLVAALGGLDALVFTGGIGEHAAPVRARIVAACAWLGLDLDPAANARSAGRITTDASRVPAYVVPTDEERVILAHTRRVLALAAA